MLALLHKEHYDAHSEQRQRKCGNVDLKTESGNNPGGNRSTNIGTHDNADGLSKGEQACIYEADNHNCRSRRRLDQGCNKHTCQNSRHTVGCHRCKNAAQLVAGKLLKAFTHYLHSVKEQSEGTHQF